MARNRPKILVFAGSIRTGSFNGQLAMAAVKSLALRDADVTRISLSDYAMPIYDGDLERDKGPPEAARRLHQLFTAHHGILIASPEYNGSVSALTKNTIDWVSRVKAAEPGGADPFKRRVFAIMGASPGYYGAIRGLMHLRHVLELGLGATVLPEQVAVPSAASAFSADGSLASERTAGMLDQLTSRLVEEAARYV